MIVTSREQAWLEVNKIFPTDYEKDYASSERAGYDIYRHHELNYYNRICDLGNRLEVLTGEYGENVTNIWVEESEEQEMTYNTFKMYEIIMEDGEHVYKHHGIYKDEKDARKSAEGNGEVVRIKDVTENFPLSGDKIFTALKNAGFGQIEANAIYSFVASNYANSI